MEIPIYFTHKDFLENYEKDFKNYSSLYNDANENDFKNELKKIYRIAVKNVTLIEIDHGDEVFVISEVQGTEIILKLQTEIRDVDGSFNHHKIKMLNFSFERILETLRFEEPKNEVPENDFSDSKPKEKLILLDKLGITNLLISQLSDKNNATHLADIISAITGIDNKKGTLTGYCNYLIRPDNHNRNSPYNSENTISNSMQIYSKFKLKD